MMRRIGLWALAGFTVAWCWVIYALIDGPGHNLGSWTIVAVTLPASLLGRSRPQGYLSAILLNAAIYALVGLAIEPLWRRRHILTSSR